MSFIKYPLEKTSYVAVEVPKKHIVWHAVGLHEGYDSFFSPNEQAVNIISNWNSPDKDSYAWFINENGDIYSCYPDKFWSHHLSLGKKTSHRDKESVPIAVFMDKLGYVTDAQAHALVDVTSDICGRYKLNRTYLKEDGIVAEKDLKKATVFRASNCQNVVHDIALTWNLFQFLSLYEFKQS